MHEKYTLKNDFQKKTRQTYSPLEHCDDVRCSSLSFSLSIGSFFSTSKFARCRVFIFMYICTNLFVNSYLNKIKFKIR